MEHWNGGNSVICGRFSAFFVKNPLITPRWFKKFLNLGALKEEKTKFWLKNSHNQASRTPVLEPSPKKQQEHHLQHSLDTKFLPKNHNQSKSISQRTSIDIELENHQKKVKSKYHSTQKIIKFCATFIKFHLTENYRRKIDTLPFKVLEKKWFTFIITLYF